MSKFLRLISAAIAVLIAVRVLAWLLDPALPLLLALGGTGLALYIAVNGRRGL